MRALTALAGVLVAVLPTTAYAAGDPIPPHPPSQLSGLPDDVFHGQVVTLADGDRYEVTHERLGRSIRGRRWDASTSAWGPLQVIFRPPGQLLCWGAQARGSGTGVAVKVVCNKWGTGVDDGNGEGRPFAIVSADTQNWQSRELPGHAYRDPGISPSGTRAVWSDYEDYVTWDPASGFVRHVATPPIDFVANEAATITDDGTVTIAYVDTACSVTFDTYSAPGDPSRQTVPTTQDCDQGIVAINARTVVFGEQRESGQSLLTRPDDTSPWVVSVVAPLYAPGVMHDVHEAAGAGPTLLDVPDLPLAMVGNASADELGVQVFDPATQSWRPPSTLVTRPGGTKCSLRQDDSPRLRFYALQLTCAGPNRYVTSTDGGSWQALPIASEVAGTYLERGLVAVPGRQRTVVVGRDSAPVTLPVGSAGGCDVVQPVATNRVLRLTASKGSHGWPDVLQRSTAKGWRTVRHVPMPTEGSCRAVFTRDGWAPGFTLHGGGRTVAVGFVKDQGRWGVRVR